MHECACRTRDAQKSITNLPLFTPDIGIPLTIPISSPRAKNEENIPINSIIMLSHLPFSFEDQPFSSRTFLNHIKIISLSHVTVFAFLLYETLVLQLSFPSHNRSTLRKNTANVEKNSLFPKG